MERSEIPAKELNIFKFLSRIIYQFINLWYRKIFGYDLLNKFSKDHVLFFFRHRFFWWRTSYTIASSTTVIIITIIITFLMWSTTSTLIWSILSFKSIMMNVEFFINRVIIISISNHFMLIWLIQIQFWLDLIIGPCCHQLIKLFLSV